MSPAMEVKHLYLAFSKKDSGYKAKLAAFNRGLKAIQEDGTFEEILERHGF